MRYYVSIFLKGIRDKKPNHFAIREETEFSIIQKSIKINRSCGLQSQLLLIFYVLAVSWNHGGGSYDKQTALRR